MGRAVEPPHRRPRGEVLFACLVLIVLIGALDYVLGADITIAAAYFVPISLAAWFLGARAAFGITLLTTLAWVAGNLAVGQGSVWAILINGVIRTIFYGFVALILVRLNRLQKDLEARAEERAAALARETAERERLEHDMLEISEREQRRIGQDLHDGLCQHLTGTALAGHVLAEKLAGRAEAASAHKIVDLVEEAIGLARGVAKGLHPVALGPDGLMQALEEFAVTVSEMFGVRCQFDCPSPVPIRLPAAATHLYRIAQEGVGNAIKHGKATEIVILLEENETQVRLAVLDNGQGVGDAHRRTGMGLRIMADRAKMIGGHFSLTRNHPSGAALDCLVPLACLVPGETRV
jgi:signal transduction histidine kinase